VFVVREVGEQRGIDKGHFEGLLVPVLGLGALEQEEIHKQLYRTLGRGR
jgi:hypothetical protein